MNQDETGTEPNNRDTQLNGMQPAQPNHNGPQFGIRAALAMTKISCQINAEIT